MRLLGEINYHNRKYIYALNQNKQKTEHMIINKTVQTDMMDIFFNKKNNTEELSVRNMKGFTPNHIKEFVTKQRVSGEVKHLPNSDNKIVYEILGAISKFRQYGYRADQKVESKEIIGGKLFVKVRAETKDFKVDYNTMDNQYVYIDYKSKDLSFNLENIKGAPTYVPPNLVRASRTLRERVYLENVSSVRFEDLVARHDVSHMYNVLTNTWVKDYRMISTIEEFEKYVMTPLLRELNRCITNKEKLLLAMDTESTGLNIFNLPSGSELKDSITTMQLSWTDNQSVLINFDMESFENVDLDYVMKRLFPLVKEYTKTPDDKGKPWENIPARNRKNKIKSITGEEIEFCRNDILVIGHNTIFDSKVTLDTGYQWFFDEDTLQMIFDLDPVGTKGKKGLKATTKRLLGIDQWELSDTLGKGNEDKFRYIQDERVALAYGCADSDCTRMNWKILRKLMPDTMYKAYKKFNMYTWFLLAQSEYEGLRINKNKLDLKTDIAEKNLKKLDNFIYHFVGGEIKKKSYYRIVKDQQDRGLFKGNIAQEITRLFEETKQNNPESLVYKFKITGSDLRTVLYDKLEYPCEVYTEKGDKAVNKRAMEKLLRHKYDIPSNLMKHDLYTVDYDKDNPRHHKNGKVKDDYILIKASEVNKYRYPLAFILSKYAELDKEYTGYYKPFSESDWGGRIYKGYSTTNIETQRISNPIQTTKKGIKELIIEHGEDWYCFNWDKAQIEARVFVAEAGDYRMVERLNNPENDYHTENASLMYDIKPYLVTKKQRKASKTINFGLPYGLGPDKMCERIHGVINKLNILDTNEKIFLYKKANMLTWNLLESYRDSALIEWKCSDELKKFLGYEGRKLGRVVNASGFHRLFDLTDVKENWQREKIRRAAGNFPIQSYAKDIFTWSIIRFHLKLCELGIRDKIKIHMLVHDEIQCSAHKSIDPVYLMSILQECCMPRIAVKEPAVKPEGEISPTSKYMSYYIGINFGDNWLECKKDENECPVNFVRWMVSLLKSGEYKPVEWCDRPKDILTPYMHQFFIDRVYKEVNRLQPDIDNSPIDLDRILKTITNYTVRAYITDNFANSCNIKVPKEGDKKLINQLEDYRFFSHLIGWSLEKYGEDKKILFDGVVYNPVDLINKGLVKDLSVEDIVDEVFEEDNEDDYDFVEYEDDYSFDPADSVQDFINALEYQYEDEKVLTEYEIELEKKEEKVILDRKRREYGELKALRKLAGVIVIDLKNEEELNMILNECKGNSSQSEDAYRFRIKVNGRLRKNVKIDQAIDLIDLDQKLIAMR